MGVIAKMMVNLAEKFRKSGAPKSFSAGYHIYVAEQMAAAIRALIDAIIAFFRALFGLSRRQPDANAANNTEAARELKKQENAGIKNAVATSLVGEEKGAQSDKKSERKFSSGFFSFKAIYKSYCNRIGSFSKEELWSCAEELNQDISSRARMHESPDFKATMLLICVPVVAAIMKEFDPLEIEKLKQKCPLVFEYGKDWEKLDTPEKIFAHIINNFGFAPSFDDDQGDFQKAEEAFQKAKNAVDAALHLLDRFAARAKEQKTGDGEVANKKTLGELFARHAARNEQKEHDDNDAYEAPTNK